MTSTIVLTTKHLVDTTKNSTFQYDFPNSIKFEEMELALVGGAMYYSWFNISKDLNNTKFEYEYVLSADPNGDPVKVQVELEEGLYEISDLNKALQHSFIINDLYLVDSNGDYVYFAEFLINPTLYSCDINSYIVPTLDSNTYTQASIDDFPAEVGTFLNIRLLSGFNEILGFEAGFETNSSFAETSDFTRTSSSAPNVQPNSSVLVDCNLIDNPYGNPAGIISTIIPNVSLGGLISIDPNEHTYSPILKGIHNNVRIRLLNKTTLQPLSIRDPQITLVLGIRKKK